MVPRSSDRISRVPPYLICPLGISHTGLSPISPSFQLVLLTLEARLVRVRSPLLTEYRLISFPPGTEMFQFPGFALLTLYIQVKSTWFNRRSSDADLGTLPQPCARAGAERRCDQQSIDCQVGFPIRTSRDQRVLSPPPGLSQSATSFIASCCQGIHQTPLSRLIRSRRRRALLRDGWFKPSTHPHALDQKSSTRAHPLGRRRAGSRVLNDPRRIRQSSRSVSFDLERLSLVVLPRFALLEDVRPRTTPDAADAARSPLGNGPKNVSCFALFTMSVAGCRHPACQYLAAIARSDRKAHHRMNLPIRSSLSAYRFAA